MEFRLKPLGLVLLLLITGSAVVFDFAEWSKVRVEKRQSQAELTGSGHLVLLASSASGGWLQKQVDRFNLQNKGNVDITIRYKECDAALHDILAQRDKPTMWAPGGGEWASRLGDLWAKHHGGQGLVNVADAASFRTYLRTPLVFVSRRNPAVTGQATAAGSERLVDSALGGAAAQTGDAAHPAASCRVGFADPGTSDSGRMTIGVILSNYALRNGGSADDLDTVANSPGFLQFLRDLHEKPISGSGAKQIGESGGVLEAFLRDPKRGDLVAAYESDALAAAEKDPNLVVTYPSPTCVQDQSVAILSGGHWVSPQQRAAAQSFLRFLSSSESLSEGVKAHFRPVNPTAQLTLAGELKAMGKRGFRQVIDAIDRLPYSAAEDAAYAWKMAAGSEAQSTARIVAYAR